MFAPLAATFLVAALTTWAGARQPDELPDKVVPGRSYRLVQNQLIGDVGCRLWLGGVDVGACAGRPLSGRLEVQQSHPRGSQKLFCRACRRTPVTTTPTELPSTSFPPPVTEPSTTTPPPTSSTGPREIKMPDLVGLPEKEALDRLRELGWNGPWSTRSVDAGSDQLSIVQSQKPAIGVLLKVTAPVEVDIGGPPIGLRRQPLELEIEIATVTVEPPEITTPGGSLVPALVALLIALAAAAGGIGLLLRSRSGGGPPSDRSEPPTGAGVPGVRSVRVGFSDASGRPVSSNQPLRPGRSYRFWVDIGELPGVVARVIVPLRVVLYDPDLPILDRSSEEVALSTSAVGRIGFTFRAPVGSRRLRLRCALYCRGVLLQSFAVAADVLPPNQPGGWSSDRDYVTSFGLDPLALSEMKTHALSLMINHNDHDEHGIYACFGDHGVQVSAPIPANHVAELQRRARLLYADTGAAGWDQAKLPQLLGALALHGWSVFTTIQTYIDDALRDRGYEPGRVWDELLRPALVQVVWPAASAQPLPAATIYDYPLAEISSEEMVLCSHYFADLRARQRPRCLNGRCLSGSDWIVCPAGFWGFRLEMGSPRSLGPELPLPDRGYERSEPPTVVLGKSSDPRFVLRDRHLRWLHDQLAGVSWYETDRVDVLLAQLRSLQPTLIYLYCHGGVDREQGIGWIEIGAGERLSARGIPRDFGGRWRSGPLVLLNGCSTAALDDGQPNPLANRLLWAGAAGAVGTEIDVHEEIACRFADRFVLELLSGAGTVGEAMREARTALLLRGSAVGLSYLALAPADLRLVAQRARS
jgi:hypothetical protein